MQEVPNTKDSDFVHRLLERTILDSSEPLRWEDVLFGFCSLREGESLLRHKKIDVSRLYNDLQFSRLFTGPKYVESAEALNIIKQKLNSLEARDFAQAAHLREREKKIVNTYQSRMEESKKYVLATIKQLSKSVEALETSSRKDVRTIIEEITKYITPDIPETHVDDAMQLLSMAYQSIMTNSEYADKGATAASFEMIGEFIDATTTHAFDNPAYILGGLQHKAQQSMTWVTPRKVFQKIMEHLTPQYKYLVYRAGYEVPQGYEPVALFPKSEVTDAAVRAYNIAKDDKSNLVTPKHLLLQALAHYPIIKAINESSKKDINWIRTELIKNEDTPKESFRRAIAIQQSTNALLYQMDKSKSPEAMAKEIVSTALQYNQIKKVFEAAECDTRKLFLELHEAFKTVEATTIFDQGFVISEVAFTENLSKYGRDLTAAAREGKNQAVKYRDDEINKVLTILLQVSRGNPLLIGEAGVGKTAIFQGVAERIITGKVPEELVETKIIVLDLNAMNAGAMYRGMFEERLLSMVKGASERNKAASKPLYIFCIDELHSAINAGSASETSGAGELLKAHLTEGTFRIIGATTQREYAQHICKDKALDRRFSTIEITEPDLDKTKKIVHDRAIKYFKNISVPKKLLDRLVDLCDQFIPKQHQPDKSITVMDYAFALTKLEGSKKLTNQHVEKAVSTLSHVDPQFLHMDEHLKFIKLREELPKLVLGQKNATESITKAIFRARAGLNNPKQPMGTFLLPGPTGVGKTETAKALALLLFGSVNKLTHINMSDFHSEIDFTKLTGAAPGYIGHGEEGTLTGAVRRNPHGVILLDEFEKAAKSIQSKLLPIFEEGVMLDGMGQITNFRNCLIIITTNIGAKTNDYLGACKQYFTPEFLNRMTATIPFDYLDKDTILTLSQRSVEEVIQRLSSKMGITLTVTPECIASIAEKGYSKDMGAREIKRMTMALMGDKVADVALTSGKTKLVASFTDGDINVN